MISKNVLRKELDKPEGLHLKVCLETEQNKTKKNNCCCSAVTFSLLKKKLKQGLANLHDVSINKTHNITLRSLSLSLRPAGVLLSLPFQTVAQPPPSLSAPSAEI